MQQGERPDRGGRRVVLVGGDSGDGAEAELKLPRIAAQVGQQLVVDQSMRGKGVGSALVEHAERWAMQQGAHNLALTSALRRKEAHEFYKRRDYEHTGVRLVKILSTDGSASNSASAAELSPTNQQD